MTTENMPTTNQGADYRTLSDKIPPNAAAGFEKTSEITGKAVMNLVKKSASAGMNNT